MKFRLTVGTSMLGSEVTRDFEVDDEDLDGLLDEDRNAVIEEVGREVMLEAISWDWEEDAPRELEKETQ